MTINANALMRIFLFIFLMSLATAAFSSTLIVQTLSETELKNSPNGSPVATIKQGTFGAVISVDAPWIEVYFGDATGISSVTSGWIHISKIDILDSFVSGDDCETDYDTDAQVCVTIEDTNLDCYKNYEGNFASCDVEIEYTVETDLDDDDKYLFVEIECEADISYKRRNQSSSWESDDDDESHTLYANGSDYGEIDLEFYFSSYSEVYSVSIDDAECEIDSAYSY